MLSKCCQVNLWVKMWNLHKCASQAVVSLHGISSPDQPSANTHAYPDSNSDTHTFHIAKLKEQKRKQKDKLNYFHFLSPTWKVADSPAPFLSSRNYVYINLLCHLPFMRKQSCCLVCVRWFFAVKEVSCSCRTQRSHRGIQGGRSMFKAHDLKHQRLQITSRVLCKIRLGLLKNFG